MSSPPLRSREARGIGVSADHTSFAAVAFSSFCNAVPSQYIARSITREAGVGRRVCTYLFRLGLFLLRSDVEVSAKCRDAWDVSTRTRTSLRAFSSASFFSLASRLRETARQRAGARTRE